MKKHFLATFLILLATSSMLLAQPFSFYASSGSDGMMLYRVDGNTGQATPLVPYGAYGPLAEIQFDPTGSVLYATTGGGTSNFITIDPDSGDETLIGTFPARSINGMEFVDNMLYGVHSPGFEEPSQLVIIDPLTADLTFIGPTGYIQITGMAYDNNTGIMYGIAGYPDYFSQLVTIDLVTGAASLVGTIDNAACRGLEFGPDGQLYTCGVIDGGAPPTLYIVNPNTADLIPVGPTGTSWLLSGLAYENLVEIPLSNWAILIGVLLIGSIMIIRFRR